MVNPAKEGFLRHDRISGRGGRTQLKTSIGTLLKQRGPVRDYVDGEFEDEFLDHCHLERGPKVWTVVCEYGAERFTHEQNHLLVLTTGRVDLKWALRLRAALRLLYAEYLDWRGDVTTEPPKGCPNDIHRDWNPNYSRLNDPTFAPDDGYWRCLGCGWLLDSDGLRIREKYSMIAPEPRAGTKKGGRRLD